MLSKVIRPVVLLLGLLLFLAGCNSGEDPGMSLEGEVSNADFGLTTTEKKQATAARAETVANSVDQLGAMFSGINSGSRTYDYTDALGFKGTLYSFGYDIVKGPYSIYQNQVLGYDLAVRYAGTVTRTVATPPITPPPATPALRSKGDRLVAPSWGFTGDLSASKLFPYDYLESPNKAYRLLFQPDGNLVLYNALGQALWHTATFGERADSCLMQPDGNFVIYDGSRGIWDTGMPRDTVTYLQLRNVPASPQVWIQVLNTGHIGIYYTIYNVTQTLWYQ